MEFIAFIVTVLVGFVAESLLGNWLNWPGVGAVFAAAAAAAFILRRCGVKKRLPNTKRCPIPGRLPRRAGKMILVQEAESA
ncbi:MAG: hypothetical protein ACLRZH_13415 [Ruthenibacterium lactatiformans]